MIATFLATVVMVLLPHGGHVFGGQPARLVIRPVVAPAVTDATPAAWQDQAMVLDWQLMHAGLQLAAGRQAYAGQELTLELAFPPVRAVTPMDWRFRILSSADGQAQAIDQGQVRLWVHPASDGQWARTLADQVELTVVCADADSTLPALLTRLGLKHRVVGPQDPLAIRSASWLILEGQLSTDRVTRQAMQACRRGARLLVLTQGMPQGIAGQPHWLGGTEIVRPVMRPGAMTGHPLLAGFEQAWVGDWPLGGQTIHACRRDADAPGLAVVGWVLPSQIAEDLDGKPRRDKSASQAKPAPLRDALVWTQPMDAGQVVVWRLPAGDWLHDPRAELMLRNSLLHLVNPPGGEQAAGVDSTLPERDTP